MLRLLPQFRRVVTGDPTRFQKMMGLDSVTPLSTATLSVNESMIATAIVPSATGPQPPPAWRIGPPPPSPSDSAQTTPPPPPPPPPPPQQTTPWKLKITEEGHKFWCHARTRNWFNVATGSCEALVNTRDVSHQTSTCGVHQARQAVLEHKQALGIPPPPTRPTPGAPPPPPPPLPPTWKLYVCMEGNHWWYNNQTEDWFYTATGSQQVPRITCDDSRGRTDACRCLDTAESYKEDSTTTGGGSASLPDSASGCTSRIHEPGDMAILSGPRPPSPIKGDCTHLAFMRNLYSEEAGTHEAPEGIFVMNDV